MVGNNRGIYRVPCEAWDLITMALRSTSIHSTAVRYTGGTQQCGCVFFVSNCSCVRIVCRELKQYSGTRHRQSSQ